MSIGDEEDALAGGAELAVVQAYVNGCGEAAYAVGTVGEHGTGPLTADVGVAQFGACAGCGGQDSRWRRWGNGRYEEHAA